VQEVPTLQHEGHQDAFEAGPGSSTGILEDPDGVTRLTFLGRELAWAPAAKADIIKGTYKLGGEIFHIEWTRWSLPELYWTHTVALLLLQGASLQQVMPAWLVLRADRWPASCPTPGAANVVLAELRDPPPLTALQLFELLLPEAGGACAPASS
jgi:hypothetical protein